MQFTLFATTFLATLAAAAPVAVPKTTVVEREAGGLGGLGGLTSLTSLLNLGQDKASTPPTQQLNSVGAGAGQQHPKAGGGGGLGGGLGGLGGGALPI